MSSCKFAFRHGQVLFGLLLGAVSCSGDGESDADRKGGDLSCEQTAVECRSAFADTYEGTYSGAESGSLLLDIDVLGDVQGSVVALGSSQAASGRVNEFGRLEFESEDGTVYIGQFTQDKRFSGTWTATDGSTGTFEGASINAPPESEPEPGDDQPNPPSSPATPPSSPSNPPSSSDVQTVIEAATAACEAVDGCGSMAEDCEMVQGTEEDLAPAECRDLELAAYDCVATAGCDFEAVCEQQVYAVFLCIVSFADNSEL